MRATHKVFALVLTSLFALSPLPLFAQETGTKTPYEPFVPTAGEASQQNEEELASCFDFYRFGSTPIIVQSNLTTVSQGAPIVFSGTLTNENDYPLSDVSIKAKILHKRNPGVKDSFGPDVVDWFTVAEHITVKAKGSLTVPVSWDVPQDATPGEYRLALYVISHDRFNMLGLSFTNDIIGGNYPFTVVGDDVGVARFDVTQTKVGDTVLHAAAFSPRITFEDAGVPVRVFFKNSSNKKVEGTVAWKLYAWDANRPDQLIENSSTNVSVDPYVTNEILYTVKDTQHTVYYLVGEFTPLTPGYSKSYVSIRFVDSNANPTPRINFVGSTHYPVDENSVAFACLHSTGSAPTENVKMELTATSNRVLDFILGRQMLAQKTYEGTAPGELMAVTASIAHSAADYTVTARLFQDGRLVDEVSVPFVCDALQTSCDRSNLYILIAGVIVLIVIVGGVFIIRRRKNVPTPPLEQPREPQQPIN